MDLIKRNGFNENPFPFHLIKLISRGNNSHMNPMHFISSLNYDSEDIMQYSIKSTGADSISGSYPELHILRKQEHSI